MESLFVEVVGNWSYLGLLLVLLAAGMGLPLPEDIPLILAGFLVSRGNGDLFLMMLTGLAGVIIGDSILFCLGHRYGPGIVEHRWFRRFAKPWLIERARQKYENHGAKILFAARFMPGLRAVLFLTAGVFRVPYWKFITFDGTAALISVPVWIWAGWKFSSKIQEVFAGARMASYIILSVLAVALLVWILWEYNHNLKRRKLADAVPESASGILAEATATLVDAERPRRSPRDAVHAPDDSPIPAATTKKLPARVE